MNLTLSIDKATVQKARKAAEGMGMSLNQAIREFLAELAGERSATSDIQEMRDLSLQADGHSGGRKLDRDELHERS